MPQSEVVVLASSIKHGQYCVAGKCVHTGRWIRPVSNLQGGELSNLQVRVQNPHGTFRVKPLQKVRIGIMQHVPLVHQPENYLIDGTVWVQNYSFDAKYLGVLLDAPANLWGVGNRIDYSLILHRFYEVTQSLYFVQVENLRLYYTDDERRRVSFIYGGIDYDFAATDPRFDEIMRAGLPTLGMLCISLGEQYQGFCYKIVAAIY